MEKICLLTRNVFQKKPWQQISYRKRNIKFEKLAMCTAEMKEQETHREKRISGTGWSSEYLWANT